MFFGSGSIRGGVQWAAIPRWRKRRRAAASGGRHYCIPSTSIPYPHGGWRSCFRLAMSPVSPPLPRCSSLLMGMGGSGMGSSLEDVPLCRCWCDPRRPRTNGIDGDRFVQHRLLVSTIVPGLVVVLARQGGHQMQTVNLDLVFRGLDSWNVSKVSHAGGRRSFLLPVMGNTPSSARPASTTS